jgi:hypothetical protein
MKNACITIILILSVLTNVFAQQQDFINNMQAYCGKSFAGVPVFPVENNPMGNERLVVIFESCNDTEMRMPFHVGTDKSRTWILTQTPDGLLFKHDHRHEDGTPDEVTNYGGFANSSGNALVQYFPADQFTKELIPYAAGNEWSFEIDQENKQLHYVLKRDGALRFKATFDLSKELN